ncbi:MAG: phenylalanine--tRNA ligase subunit beta [Candidatus Bathyarchaeota archaeon]|nr:MAG: phenylalanine--tRNA ligase subunit beta [Candidatus Bathyarchaeota archaeon]
MILTRERLSKYVGKPLSLAEIVKWLPWLGFDIEEVGEDEVKVEFNPNRIDFSSYMGVARALKGLRGWELGLQKYDLQKGKTVLKVDSAVSAVRPFMLGAIVRNLKLNEEEVAELMEIQEDLHWGIGRDRVKASIGVHNLDGINPPFTFTAIKPNAMKFAPLGTTKEMSLWEILKNHEKGVQYKHLIDWASEYPLLVDRDGKVLSMPPIINGELTRVDENTENLFLDVTGTDYEAVNKSLNVLSTALADMGGRVETVKVEYPNRTVHSPNFTPQKMNLQTRFVNDLLGLKLSQANIIESLKKCRLGAKKNGKEAIEVAIPVYRIDIFHEVDLVEEVAIGHGYYKLKPTLPSSVTIGKQHPAYIMANRARQIMIGLGFVEVLNFTLTNEHLHYKKMRRKAQKPVKLANPVSSEYTIMREDLLPYLMKNLAENKHESFPQKLFEVSDVVNQNSKMESRCERLMHLAAVSSHSSANFTEIRSAVEALLSNMGVRHWDVRAVKHPSFTEGRIAALNVKKKQIGIVGEVHPEVLNNFELENPTAAFEVNLEIL